ncbi:MULTISPECIES: sacsin N-terminal ATP-binding-like domain-containing protein [unclassified Lacrimispora]|uniref:sacsin N-terminal ATP-binding-like domain-containing protein n=1 Tax=unclassified Lacrimispora TaxID=2719232 RepID=UPI00376F85B9
MSLKSDVEKIYSDNTNYSNPGQAVNQASSLNALSADLYTDSKRFIYELLQNADDSSLNDEGVKVWIKIFGKHLVVAHSGKPFSPRDLQGICNINNGTKKSDLTKTGYKGIGFKSVFGQSENVTIFTNKEYFRFDSSYTFEWNWDDSMTEWEKKNDRKFQFPWQIIPIYTEVEEIDESINRFIENIGANVATIIQMKNAKETSQAVLNLSQNLNMFLFLKNISEINFDVRESVSIEINRDEKERITLKNGNVSKSDWLISTISLIVPDEVKTALQDERNIPDKLLSADSIELTLAAKVGNDGITRISEQETLLYSYLPTDERKYSLPVLVNASFLTTANRESLHADSKWNQWLFRTIAIEIIKWISRLVITEYSFQAYQLIPKEIRYDDLGNKFNEGIKEALEKIPFIITREGNLAKIEDTIVDFTYLSEKTFVGEEPIKKFIHKEIQNGHGRSKQFVEDSPFMFEFKRLGSSCFEWRHLQTFFLSPYFFSGYTIDKNIELIKHLKKLCESNKVKEITKETLIKLPFIWDHKNQINYPCKVCFPTADDQNWDNPNSDLSFLHRELQVWLLKNLDVRQWLESLGVQEKTDITYITQNILPNIESYITSENALQTICDLFSLYKKGNLREDLIGKLSRIRLITKNGSFSPAEECYLSDFYKPRLEIEKIIDKDIFVCETYCVDVLEKDEWRRFLKMFGVHEGIKTIQLANKLARKELIAAGFNDRYFETDEKKFKPFQTVFSSDSFSEVTTMNFIQLTENNPKFALRFWTDYIENYLPNIINLPAIAFWGHHGMPGQTNGNSVENYIPWFVRNIKCIPTTSEKCESSPFVLLNTSGILNISGKYLDVFNGPELSSEWRAFFNFRTNLELRDYLELLNRISVDVDEKGNIKKDNYKRVQSIYSALLIQCVNWNENDIADVENWVISGCLLNTQNQFSECTTIKFFIDGNEAIFQEQYCFIQLSAENKNSPYLEKLLLHFNVQILRQSEFDLICAQEEICSELINKLKITLPYFKKWIENEDSDEDTKNNLENIEGRLDILNVFQAEELKITYSGIDFTKNVNIHFNETSLYVTDPWNSNSVLLKLSDVLCKYFKLIGHEKKLDFLLRSSGDEIQKYFVQEDIEIPSECLIVDTSITALEFNDTLTKPDGVDDFFEDSTPDLSKKMYIKSLIPRAVYNVLKHLSTLSEYDCSSAYMISESVIGGITKNGNDIKVVARPSDNDKIRLFYDSEFDVLEYVDAELWYEDGATPPKQFTLGQLLKMKKINKIPIKQIQIKDLELNNPKSEILDFDAVPFSPEKTAQTISAFANNKGGTILFGIKELSALENEIVGLSTDFNVVDITNKAISMLSPTPDVSFDWLKKGEELIFVIEIKKANEDILLNNQKYIRESNITKIEKCNSTSMCTINNPRFEKTIAIIIAIENYAVRSDNQVDNVKFAIKDASRFKEMLISSMGVEQENIFEWKNEEALKSNLDYELKSLFYSLTESDRLIFYYVGHGFHDGVTNYLSTYDIHPFNIAETAISLRKILLDPLQQSKCKNALIFIDACAKSFDNKNERSHISNINEEEFKIISSNFESYSIFLSCNPGQSSYSCDDLENGIWTYFLTKAITEPADEVVLNHQFITDRKLGDYLSLNVSSYAKSKNNWNQNPKTILDSSYENVITEIK